VTGHRVRDIDGSGPRAGAQRRDARIHPPWRRRFGWSPIAAPRAGSGGVRWHRSRAWL